MIRRIKQADAVKIEKILRKISHFTETEVNVGMELVSTAATDDKQDDYNVYVYEEEDVLGYYCIGKRPLTDAVYDLYWIVVDPEANHKGIGKKLIQHAEKLMIEMKGRWLLAETSSKSSYLKARNFYLRNNFTIVSQINDFYSIGDNLIVFGKFFK